MWKKIIASLIWIFKSLVKDCFNGNNNAISSAKFYSIQKNRIFHSLDIYHISFFTIFRYGKIFHLTIFSSEESFFLFGSLIHNRFSHTISSFLFQVSIKTMHFQRFNDGSHTTIYWIPDFIWNKHVHFDKILTMIKTMAEKNFQSGSTYG